MIRITDMTQENKELFLKDKSTMSEVPEVLSVIDGKYDDWIPLKRIIDDVVIAEHVQTISCDTRDFALGWNFNKPQPYKKADCGLEVSTNEGLARMRRIQNSPAINDYLIEASEIIPWLKQLCEKSGGYEEDWRMLDADVEGCRDWDIKYIRFVRHDNNFMVCNVYWMPVKWRKIIANLRKPY